MSKIISLKKMAMLCFGSIFCFNIAYAQEETKEENKNQHIAAIVTEEQKILKEIENSKDKIFIEFYSQKSTPCKILSPIYEVWSDNLNEGCKFFKIDINQAKDLCEKYDVYVVPTMLVFEKGKLLEQKTGLPDIACYLEDFQDDLNQIKIK